MNTTEIPNLPGTPFEGGVYVGRVRHGDDAFALIVSPKAEGEHDDIEWGKYGEVIEGANSFFDGLANTEAMAEAGSEIAQWARQLRIAGFDDWYLPSRDELELCYRYLKPTTDENYVWRSGENPSALPFATHPYTATAPTQSAAEVFRSGGTEAFEDASYWSSTQYSAHGAWTQSFDDGSQSSLGKGYALRARAVRRFKISN